MNDKTTTFRTISIRVIALALSLWLFVLYFLTWAVAEDYRRQIEYLAETYTQQDFSKRENSLFGDIPELPGAMEARMIQWLRHPHLFLRTKQLFPFVLQQIPGSFSSDDWIGDKWDLLYGCDFSVVFYGEGPQAMMHSGNRMSFAYVDEQSWTGTQLEPQGYGWVDLDAIPGAAKTMQEYIGYNPLTGSCEARMFLPLIRLTGWFENNQFHPVTLERGWYADSNGTVDDLALLNSLDEREKLEWQTLLEIDVPQNQPLVTVYGWDVDGIMGNFQKPVTVEEKNYASLTKLLMEHVLNYNNDQGYGGLGESVFISEKIQRDSYGIYGYVLAVRSRPLQYAMLRLCPAYLVFTALMALAVWQILRRIRRNFIVPLNHLNTALKTGAPIPPSDPWKPARDLEHRFAGIRQTLTDAQAENTRLTTALDYAQEAEEKRKELISNLAHELKTPLAVIHSYSEGLQADIAPNKREHYIQTILEETGRMDGMVMQMLELSQLDTGKVTLNMEIFPLSALIRTVTDKLAPLMKEKNLHIRLELDGEAEMNGDVVRMEQVITNYVSNAVKYSPQGGQILIKATGRPHGIFFSIANTTPHLSEEALNRVYDSFYRVDTARTEKSTGLGLAIVKGIMTLHGCRCYVLNSQLDGQDAVEFGFSPLA